MATSFLSVAMGMGPCCALWVVLALLKGLKGQAASTQPGVSSVLQSFQEDQVWGLGGRGRKPGSECREKGGPWRPGKALPREPRLPSLVSDRPPPQKNS